MKFIINILVVSFTSLLVVACGGGGGGININQGVFLDSAVAGLEYVSGGQSGITDAGGTFTYETGATVTFSIGDIVIGEGLAQAVMTPLDLIQGSTDVTDPTVTNITRFLLTLDDDADPDNGITIIDLVRAQAIGQTINFNQTIADFENDGNVQIVVAELTALTSAGARLLVTSVFAQDHLDLTLIGAIPNLVGTYVGTGTISNTNCTDPDINTTINTTYTVTITSQTGSTFSGTIASELVFQGVTFSGTDDIEGTITSSGAYSGTMVGVFEQTTSAGTFSGQLTGNTLTINYLSNDTSGETCTTSGTLTATAI